MTSTNPKDKHGRLKPNLHLIPASALLHISKAMEYGAKKYSPYNWRTKKVSSTIYISACMRHLLCYLDGETKAKDSGVHHLAHAAACISILLDAEENKCLLDDRPTKGNAPNLIEKLKNK